MVQPQHAHRPPLRPVLDAYVNVTAASYTAKAGDRVIGVNRAGAVTVTLPTAEVRKGRVYTVKDESGAAATNNITVATEGAETIDGAATDTIADNYGCVTYYSGGTSWFTIPLLAVSSHSLASHSSEAHSELSGVGTDDHHAQLHQAAHNSAGADALKMDDLAAPDDNTDLNFSTTAHGLVPKGTNTGNFLKDDGTWAAPSSSGAVTREGGNTTEATTTSTSQVDLLTAATLTIAATEAFILVGVARKTTGAAAKVALGFKINTTVLRAAETGGNINLYGTGAGDLLESGGFFIVHPSRVTNYLRTTFGSTRSYGNNNSQSGGASATGEDADAPTVEITDVILRGISDNASVTLGADELHVYSLAAS